jgi:hypothetical protein
MVAVFGLRTTLVITGAGDIQVDVFHAVHGVEVHAPAVHVLVRVRVMFPVRGLAHTSDSDRLGSGALHVVGTGAVRVNDSV